MGKNETDPFSRDIDRRDFIKLFGAAAAAPLAGGLLAACSAPVKSASGAKKSRKMRIGFIALTDCASIVMAKELGYFAKRNLDVELIKQASWPVTRDNLLTGQIDAAHCLFSMPISLAAGIGGKPDQLLKIAMVLNNNGQAITLKKSLAQVGYADLGALKRGSGKLAGGTYAMTFPGGTHDTWLRYWLLASGVPMSKVKIIPIPPPQMVANMKVGTMDGFCVGEPWNAQAVSEGIGFTAIATQDIFEHHPEKALVVNPSFASSRKDDLAAAMSAVLEAGRWLDDPANIPQAAKTIGVPAYVGAAPSVIEGRLLGHYDVGAGFGERTFTETRMRYFRDGLVNMPRRSHVLWFLAQYRRFGYLSKDPAYDEIADRLLIPGLYEQVAAEVKVALPGDDMKPFHVKLDGIDFDPSAPQKEAIRV